MITKITDRERREIALGVMEGTVFTSAQVHEHDLELLSMIFMPVLFGAYEDLTDEDRNDIGFIYSMMADAFPRGINGYPIFHTCKIVSKADAGLIFEYVDAMRAERAAFLGNAPEEQQDVGNESKEESEDHHW